MVGPKSEYNDGESSSFCENVGVNFVTSSKAELLEQQIECLWRLDNVSSNFIPDVQLSKEDRYALHIVKNSKALVDGHYQLALPWKPGAPRLEENRQQAVIRLSHLKIRLEKDSSMKQKHVSAMETYIANGHAQLSSNEDNSTGWFLPHHLVFHHGHLDNTRPIARIMTSRYVVIA